MKTQFRMYIVLALFGAHLICLGWEHQLDASTKSVWLRVTHSPTVLAFVLNVFDVTIEKYAKKNILTGNPSSQHPFAGQNIRHPRH